MTNSDIGGSYMASLGENISNLRKSRGLSQAQLADRLGIATSTLGMYRFQCLIIYVYISHLNY